MKLAGLTELIKHTLQPFLVSFTTFLISTSIFANPVLDNIAAGQVNIQQSPNTTTVNQSSQQAIINWQSFNIGAQETTHFQQPAGGVALNRINPSNGVSAIYGRLTATGQIILVNPAGLFFGPGSFVNVGGLIASTANITDQDFLNGYYHFANNPNFNGAIVNQGQIIAADHGLVALIGGAVSNEGMIQANMGHAVLASGNSFTMSFAGNELIGFAVDSGVNQRAVDRNGNALSNGVSNTGHIVANGGQILVSAKDAAGVLDNVINMQGVAQALTVNDGAKKNDGEIILWGDTQGGVVTVDGQLMANGTGVNVKGGNITITGHNILLGENAELNVSGETGGGNINIGGDYQGQGDLPHTKALVMLAGAKIDANAITNGDGGRVILWSDNYTNVSGEINATGGRLSGNGGLIETSGKNILNLGDISINTSAAYGNTGKWLLDPTNIYIAVDQTAATTAGMTGTNITANSGPSIFEATGNILDSLLTTATLNSALASSNIEVTTTNAAGLTALGNITIVSPIAWASTNTLTLTAANNIAINDTITTGAAGSALILNATGNVTQTAAIGGAGDLIKQGAGTATLSIDNTYTGSTIVSGGILNVATLANIGTNSSIGTGSLNPAITLDGGTIQYTGSSYIVSNRPFILGTGGGTIDHSGTTGFDLYGNITGTGNNLTITGSTGGFPGSLYGSINTGIGGSLTKTGIKFWTLRAANSYTGLTNLLEGQVTLIVAGAIPSTSVVTMGNSATLDVGPVDQTIGGLSSSGAPSALITSSGGILTIDQDSDTTFDGRLTRAFIKDGTGTLTFTGNGIGGSQPIIVNGGAMNIGNGGSSGSLQAGSTVTLNNNTSLTFNSSATTTVSNTISGTGSVTKSGSGTISLTGSNTYSGATIINGGILNVATLANIGSTSSIGTGSSTPEITLNGGTLQYTGSATQTSNRPFVLGASGGTIDGSGTTINGYIVLNGGVTGTGNTLTLTGSNSPVYNQLNGIVATGVGGGITKTGSNGWQLGGASTYTGTTLVSTGAIRLTAANVLPSASTLTISGTAVMDIGTGNQTIASLTSGSANAILTSGGGSLTVNESGTNTYAGRMGGALSLIKDGAGTLILSGFNSHSGSTTISAGTLQVGAGGTTGTLPATSIINNSNLTFNRSNLYTVDSVISGTGSLTQAGSGVLTLSAMNTYTGQTIINNGTLSVSSLNFGGSSSSIGAAPATTPLLLGGATTSGVLLYTGTASSANTDRLITVGAAGGTIQTNSGTAISLNLRGNITNNSSLTINTAALNTVITNNFGIGSFGISGTGNIIKTGDGTLRYGSGSSSFSGQNNYSGTTTISGGTLQVTNESGLGTSSLIDVTSGGSLEIRFASTLLNTNTIQLSGNGFNGNGALLSTFTTPTLSNPITLMSDASIGGTGYLILGGTISENVAGLNLTKVGTGRLFFSGNSTYTGSLNINNGIAYIQTVNALGSGATKPSGINVADGATFNVNASSINNNNPIRINGNGFTGVGAIESSSSTSTVSLTNPIVLMSDSTIGGGFSIDAPISENVANINLYVNGQARPLRLNAANTYTGETRISAGGLIITSTTGLGTTSGTIVNDGTSLWLQYGAATLVNSSPITLNGTGFYSGSLLWDGLINSVTTINNPIILGSNATIGFGSGNGSANLIMNGAISDGGNGYNLTKDGIAQISLTNTNTYSGDTTISNGRLQVGNGGATGTMGSGNIFNNSILIINRNNTFTLPGNVSGTGSLTQAGTGTTILEATNNYTGGTTISAGTLQVGSGGATGTISGNILNNAGLVFNSSGSFTYSNIISGTGTLTKNGTGTLTLNGANTYTGQTIINNGTVNANVIRNGGIASSIGASPASTPIL